MININRIVRQANIKPRFHHAAYFNRHRMFHSTSRQRSNDTPCLSLTIARRKRASLDILPSLPLDIICEIFCLLHPTDLLALVRTTKPLSSFLLNRSSAFVWRTARRCLSDLPEPPSDMTEVQFASLAFGLTCHYDGCNRRARDTVWHLRVRSCTSCRPKHQPIKLNESINYRAVSTMLNCSVDDLEQLIPCGPFLFKGNPIKGFQEHQIKTFRDGLEALPLSEREAYLERRKQDTRIVHQFASASVAWQLDAKNLRITKLRNKRTARAETIKRNLVATGFGEEIDYFGWDRICKHPLISNTQPITDFALLNLLDQLREYMLGWRELRMEEQVYASRRQLFVDAWLYFTTLALHNAPADCPYLPLPPTATVGLFERVNVIIRQPDQTSRESLLEQFCTAFVPACHYISEWHKTVRRQLVSLLPDYNPEDEDDEICSRLQLATSVFYCNSGRNCRGEGRTLTYPEILFHPCFTLMTSAKGPASRDPWKIANQKACLVMGGSPWNCSGRVQVHPKQYLVHKVLLCCGKDPRSTTATELDKQDPRLVCLECVVNDEIIPFMSWRRAVQHNIIFHPNSVANNPWVMASPISRMRIDMMECPNLRSFSHASGDTLGDYSVCLLCPPRIPSWNTRLGFGELMAHIKNRHAVFSPKFGTDYIFDTNITPVYLDPVIVKYMRKT